MGLFDFGWNQSDSTTTETDLATQKQDSSSFGRTDSSSVGSSFDRTDQSIWGAQGGALADLYRMASRTADPNSGRMAATAAQRDMLPGLQSAFGSLIGLMDPTQQIAAQTKSLQAGLGSLFSKEIMPQLDANAIGSGGFGGGRQGVAQGVAAGEMADAFTAGLGDIYARANQTAVGASAALPGLAGALYDTRMAPSQAGMDILARYADILGDPTVLTRSRGGASDVSSTTTRSGSTSTGRAKDTRTRESESSERGFEFGLF